MPNLSMPQQGKRRRRKFPVIIESGIPIRNLGRGRKPYMVDIARGYARTRICFATEGEARAEAIKQAGNLVHEGLQALALSKDQRLDAERALKILGTSATLTGAAEFFMRHTAAGEQGKAAGEVIRDLMAAKRNAGRRPATIIDAEHRLTRFAATFGERPLGTITLFDLETWLAGLEVGPVTRDNFRRAIVGLFNYAQRRGLCDGNPALGLARSGRDQTLPAILTPDQARALLITAASEGSGAMVPYFAVGLFAGLRPVNELTRLDWSSIDFKAKTIRVDPATAKRRRLRVVDLSPTLAAWLTAHRQPYGTLFFSRRLFRQIIAKAKLTKWTPDVMRHTFATYHLAAHGDPNRTALQLGHAGAPGILFDHYRGLATPEEARTFWKIRPKPQHGAGTILPFPQEKAS